MKKIRLSPFVFKVKGAKNYAFFDLLNRRLFQAGPEGDIEEVKMFLLKKELAYDTESVIPFKFHVDISNYQGKVTLRELQIRVTGRCNEACRECGEPCRCFQGGGDISKETLHLLIEQLKNVPVHEVVITGGDPLLRPSEINMIKQGIPAKKFKILSGKNIEKENSERLKRMGFEIATSHRLVRKITESKINTDAFSFFYNQEFNPCWGNTVAVDVDGSIKPCLWAGYSLGNIHKKKISDLIIDGEFEYYWGLTKDKIETCMNCEYRYGCFDCRVLAYSDTGCMDSKTVGCNYNPAE